MSRGPAKKDFRAKVRETWGEPPDWIEVLADKATHLTQAGAARALGVSPSMLSAVLSNTYAQKGGDLDGLERRVRGIWLGEQVECPAMRTRISTAQCQTNQKKKFSTANPGSVRVWRACQACPHNPNTGDRHE